MAQSVTYGIVGVGLMGIEHIRNLLVIEGARITCIADDFPASIKSCMAMLHNESPETAAAITIYSSATDLFTANICDVAVISTPNHTHHAILMDAYAHARPEMHVLVEKPLCTTVDHCREVLDAAKVRRGITWVGMEYSYMPPTNRLIADVRSGLIGPVRMCSIREHRFPFLQKVRNWNRFSANSGGTLVEKCCHFFDLFNRILAPAFPVRVFASGAQDCNHKDEVYDGKVSDILDNAFVTIEYSGGVRASLDLCMFAEASKSQEEISVVGPKGKLEAFLPQLEVRTGLRGKHALGNVAIEIVDDDRIKYKGHHHGSSFLEHLDVIAAVREAAGGEQLNVPTAGLQQGLLSVAMGVAAHFSIDEGRVVRMDEVLTSAEIEQARYT